MSEFRTDRSRSITYDCAPGANPPALPYGHVHCHGRQCACVCHTDGVHMYAVQGMREVATTDRRGNVHSVSVQLPTIYLHPDVQGIVSEDHAERIARAMFETRPGVIAAGVRETLHITAVLVTIEPHTDTRTGADRIPREYEWLAPGYVAHNRRE